MLQLLRLHYGAMELRSGRAPRTVAEALEAYFAGTIEALRSIPWATAGTPFQRSVWAALTEIPPARTCTYGELAARLANRTRSAPSVSPMAPIPLES
jgi:methylated-DNA-[protein]-cysteine S-methyltransferase